MVPRKVSKKALAGSDRQALAQLVGSLRKLYADRLQRVILYGHTNRGKQGSDLDILVVIDGITDRFVEMTRIQKVTGPITADQNILITAIPVDAGFLGSQSETSFFAAILREGIELTSEAD